MQPAHDARKSNSSPTSRRQFLQKSALATGTIAAGAIAAGAITAGSPLHCHAAEHNTIKLALIGCGGRGTGAVADAFSATGGPVKLHAMADLFDDRLKSSYNSLKGQFADRVDVSDDRKFVGFDAFKKAIDCLGPGDVAMLTTHALFRPMMFEYAVSKGVNVFMEKSFAVDSPNTRRLLKAADVAKQKNLKVSVGFMWRHCKARQAVIERIHGGEIGEVTMLRIYRVHGPVFVPKFTGGNELIFQIRHAPSFNWVSSGFLIDWHCHNIDVACWAKGAWPVSAQAFGGRSYAEAGDLFDHYTVEYTFPDGGKLFAFARHMNNCWETYSDFAHGTKGSAVLMTNLSQADTRIYKNQDMKRENLVWRFGKPEPSPYHTEWQVLLDAIRHDKPHNEAHRAGMSNIAGIMGRAAAHTGALVTWDEAMNSPFTFMPNLDAMTADTPAPIRAAADGSYAAPQPGKTKEL